MNQRRPIIIAAAIAAVLLLVSACGSSEEPLTKGQFITEGDAICKKAEEKQRTIYLKYARKHREAKDARAKEEAVVRVAGLPPITTATEELADLSAPDGEEDFVEALLGEREKAVEEADADPTRVLERTAANPFEKSDGMARKYGFKDCASSL